MLQLMWSLWQPFCLHFAKIFFICHFHWFFSMHMPLQLTYSCLLIISSIKKGRWKCISNYFCLFAFFENIQTIFQESSMLETINRRQRWNSATAQTAICGEVLSISSIYFLLAVSFSYVHLYLNTVCLTEGVSQRSSQISHPLPLLIAFIYIYVYNLAVCR